MLDKKIVIIDYGVGNLLSLSRAIEQLGENVIITKNKNVILSATHIILPGVGAFPEAMSKIKKYKLIQILNAAKKKNIFILGICLGMQILMNVGYEFKKTRGLGLIEGSVLSISKLVRTNQVKLPNIGWYPIVKKKNKILKNIKIKDSFYFLHSYMVSIKKNNLLAYYLLNKKKIPAIINKYNIYGCQFHPEKSGQNGLKFLGNFINLA